MVLGRSDREGRAAPSRSDVALVLAAGRGERFAGGTKQLAPLAGRPLVAHAVATARAAGVGRVVVVVGHDGDAVAAAVRSEDPDAEIVTNPDHAQGQSTSLTAGIRAVARDERARLVVVLLADQPGVGPEPVRAVAAAVRDGAPAARASYADAPGHPVAFSREVFARITEVQGDHGARHLLDDLDVAHVLVAGTVPRDIDTVEDLEQVRAARV
jgi:CTP:molybdopterin cytidylyltransferase MocA